MKATGKKTTREAGAAEAPTNEEAGEAAGADGVVREEVGAVEAAGEAAGVEAVGVDAVVAPTHAEAGEAEEATVITRKNTTQRVNLLTTTTLLHWKRNSRHRQ